MRRPPRHVGKVPDSEVVPRAELMSKSRRVALLRSKSVQKSPAETRGLRLGLGTVVVAAYQAASVIRTVPIPTTVHIRTPIPTVVHPTPIRRGVTRANRTVVG